MNNLQLQSTLYLSHCLSHIYVLFVWRKEGVSSEMKI